MSGLICRISDIAQVERRTEEISEHIASFRGICNVAGNFGIEVCLDSRCQFPDWYAM